MYLTDKQVSELIELLDVRMLGFAAKNVTNKFLTEAQKDLLKKYGIDYSTYTPTIQSAYRMGMLTELLGDASKNLSYDQIKRLAYNKKYLDLTAQEVAKVRSLEMFSWNEIRGLQNKMTKDATMAIVTVDAFQREFFQNTIKDAARETIVAREGVNQMSSRIGAKTGDWSRDLDRISDYILHNAHSQGRADFIDRNFQKGQQVYVETFDSACATCIKLYKNPDGSPKLFTTAQLRANGTNIGRKFKMWKAVIPPMHPFCRCQVETVPFGSVWSAKDGGWVSQKVDTSNASEGMKKLLKETSVKVTY